MTEEEKIKHFISKRNFYKRNPWAPHYDNARTRVLGIYPNVPKIEETTPPPRGGGRDGC